MPNINDIFPSRYLKAHELKGTSPTVTIERVGVEQVRSRVKVDTKPVLYFRGKTKGLLLNKTMAQSLTEIAGSPLTEAWAGVTVTLFATTATFDKAVHQVIRIKAPVHVPTSPRPTLPRVFTDELEIDLQDAGVRR